MILLEFLFTEESMRSTFLLAAIGAVMISGCSTTNQQPNAKVEKTQHMTKEQLVGEWACMTIYTDQSLKAADLMAIRHDGTFSNISTSSFPIRLNPEETLFTYTRHSTGSWTLEGNKITYLFLTQGNVIRQENKNSPLWEEIKKDKSEKYIRSIDKKIYQVLSTPSFEDNSVTLTITASSSGKFKYYQAFRDKKYKGFCAPITQLKGLPAN
ncbi:hypothetical protein [Marinomonas sp. THO17]|uniref:hypothetical protein n=1 Tax=Marinomonas sp. THO17 TaxID=3149048 RepID=UPI00336C2D4F